MPKPVINDASGDARYHEAFRKARDSPDEYWAEAAEELVWHKKWDTVLDQSRSPFNKWFVGGELNACYNAVDRHVEAGYGDHVAIKYDSPQTATIRYITYGELQEQVSRLAGVLSSLGVQKGDRVLIYMSTIPESIFSMLACARIGAMHVQVFGGFPASILVERMDHSKPKLLITTNYGMDGTELVQYQPKVEEALSLAVHKPEKCVVYLRPGQVDYLLKEGRDILWEEAMLRVKSHPCVPIEATSPLFILYTSGTSGQPKGVTVPVGGYIIAMRHVLKLLKTGSDCNYTWWANSNMGWAAGCGITCYGALLNGASSVLYEGKVTTTPDCSAFFRIISQHEVTYVMSSPAPFRDLRKQDPKGISGKNYPMKSLKTVFLGGEKGDPQTTEWIEKHFGKSREGYGQTECIVQCGGCAPLRDSDWQPNGSCGLPFPGFNIEILSSSGNPCKPSEVGHVVGRLPLPPCSISTMYRDDDLFLEKYMKKFPGYYDTQDLGWMDEYGFVYIEGRSDDEIKVLGHRLPVTLIEKSMMKHSALTDCVVLGLPDYITGQKPVGFYVLKSGFEDTDEIRSGVKKLIQDHMGPNGVFHGPTCVPVLPKNVNGKVMRKAIMDVLLGKSFQVPGSADDVNDFLTFLEAVRRLGLIKI